MPGVCRRGKFRPTEKAHAEPHIKPEGSSISIFGGLGALQTLDFGLLASRITREESSSLWCSLWWPKTSPSKLGSPLPSSRSFLLRSLQSLSQDASSSPPAVADSPVPPSHPRGVAGLLAWHTQLHLITSFSVNVSTPPASNSLRKPAPRGHGLVNLSLILNLELYPHHFALARPSSGV